VDVKQDKVQKYNSFNSVWDYRQDSLGSE